MKRNHITLAAVSALAVAAPLAAAQPSEAGWSNSRQLQMQFDAGVRSGAISRHEAMPLRVQLRQLVQLERQYSRAGLTGWERTALQGRSRTLSMNIRAAEREGHGSVEVADRFSAVEATDSRARITGKNEFAVDRAGSDRGDRFAEDLRIGQQYSVRHAPLPVRYRDRYRDSSAAYFGYHNDRVYQVDRATGTIMAMFDVGN